MAGLRFAALLLALGPEGQELPDGFSSSRIADGITGATAMAAAADGRVFVCEQTGALRVVRGDRLLPAPFLVVKVDSFWERGLIGVALHPDFPRTPYVYVNYVSPDPVPHHVISRFTARGDEAVPGSERVLLEGDDQTKLGGSIPAGHQGGALHFGKDGKLYIGIGEQTAGLPAQRLDTFQGKLLRIDPDGSIPRDNPFFVEAREKYRAIWAIGLRNPFAFAVQPGTGRIFVNDVGGSLWEEVNEGFAGANYGWPRAEGPSNDPAFRNPVHAYPRAVGKSITGGAFYNPAVRQFPAEYEGKYFFMDYDANWIKVLDPDNPRKVLPFAAKVERPVDLRVAPDGSLLLLNRNAWVKDAKFKPQTGSLWRIRYTGKAPPPVAVRPRRPATAALGLPMNPDRLPPSLSRTGLFRSLEPPAPAEGLLDYDVNVPQWADGAAKRRWLALPAGGKIGFAARGEWTFPAGTVLVETLERERRIETRILVVDGTGGGFGAAYRWRADQKDADLVEDGDVMEIPGDGRKRTWYTPGPLECLSCHAPPAGFILGLSARQLHRPGPDGPIRRWADRGLFENRPSEKDLADLRPLAPLSDGAASLELRARSYLDANCGGCHRPNGAGRGAVDLRFETPVADQQLVGGALLTGDLGIRDARNVVPGDPARSVLLERMRRRGDPFKMPPVGSAEPDEDALKLLAEWIRGLKQ